MSRPKLLRTFIILVAAMVLALLLVSKTASIQNEETIVPLLPSFAASLKEKPDEEPEPKPFFTEDDAPEVQVQESETPVQEAELLTQKEQIEAYIQDAVSLYPNLSANIINAIIWRESRYNPNAKNYNGTCVGLMQLSTKWHSKRAQSLGVTDLYDSYSNILTGCDLLSELLESYNLEMALMVYHGGYSYAQQYQAAGTTDQYTKDILSYANQLKGVT